MLIPEERDRVGVEESKMLWCVCVNGLCPFLKVGKVARGLSNAWSHHTNYSFSINTKGLFQMVACYLLYIFTCLCKLPLLFAAAENPCVYSHVKNLCSGESTLS